MNIPLTFTVCFTDNLSDMFVYSWSPTGGGRSVGIVRVRTKATEFVLFFGQWQAVKRALHL